MDTSADLMAAFKEIESERGIDRESLFEAIETSLLTACKKNFGSSNNVKVHMDRESGKIQVYAQKTVTDNVVDSFTEITLDDAKRINPIYNLGDICDVIITPRNFGRISAQSAKQVVMQKIREAERGNLFKEFKEKEREIVTGIVQRFDRRNMIVSMGKTEAMLPASEQVPGERYVFGDRIKVYVLEVKDTSKGPLVNVSRTHPELVKRLFENEVPEIFDGIVEIKSISREAGSRTKMAVYSKNPNVEAVGACVGQNGYRVNVVVRELRGEKIDIVNWSAEPRQFISAALNPSKTLAVVIDEATRSARIVVPDYQLSLAIGKEGQNARLAAKLTGYKIDIKSESQARATDFIREDEYFREGEPESFRVSVLPQTRPAVYDVPIEDEVLPADVTVPEAEEALLVAGVTGMDSDIEVVKEAESATDTDAGTAAAEYTDDIVYEDEYYDDEYDDEYYDDDDEYEYYDEDDDEYEYYDEDEIPEASQQTGVKNGIENGIEKTGGGEGA